MARRIAAALRLFSLYAVLCSSVLVTVLLVRAAIEAGPVANAPQPPQDAPAGQIPLLGVTVELTQYATRQERLAALRRLHDAGFGWVRQRVEWSSVEPIPGDFRWETFDAILADVVDADLTPVVVLDGSPPWARDPRDANNPLAPPQDITDFARFSAAFATRYAETVRFYQIWDEPNIAPHWGNRLVEPIHYALLLKEAAAAIRAADPNAVIITAALAPTQDRGHTAIDEVYFLQRLYAAGAAPDFDAVAVQPFGFGNPPTDPRSRIEVLNFTRLRLIRRVMLAAGDAETPIWAVRFGWNRALNVTWGTVTGAAQIRYTEEAIALARSWPWLAALGWAIDRPAGPSSEPDWGFALFDADGSVDPLLTAFTDPVIAPAMPSPTPWTLPAALAGFVVSAMVVTWRSVAAARVLSFGAGMARYRSARPAWRLAAWIALLVIYYFAIWPPLIGLCLLAAAILIYACPVDGVILVAALLPFHFQHKEINLVAVTLVLPPAHAALIATLPTWWKEKRKQAHRRIRLSDGLALTWIGISLLPAFSVWQWTAYAAGLWGLVLAPVLLYAAVRRWIVDAEQRRTVFVALAMGGLVAAVIGLIQWLSGGGVTVDGVRRLMGLTFSPDQTALYLLRTLFVVIGVMLSRRSGSWRWSWAAAAALVSVALILTGSRGALLLGIPAGIAGLIWPGRGRQMRRPAPWLIAAIGLILVAAVGIGMLLLGDRLQNSETVLRRFAIWQGALDLWRSFPIAGVGPGGFFWRYPAFIAPAALDEPNLLHAHTVWLNLTTGWGAFGLVWMAALLTWLVSTMRKLRTPRLDWLSVGAMAAFWAALIHGQVDAFMVLPELAAWNWLILGLIANQTETKI